ncbi:hypothetical protein CI238_00635 [Colletotrichum incanum]|uniref:Uncharacterized protein n=1 Tax=Colletotrichum incanum TaxID=1573173 RepID=A0A161VF90_COLIC|nr:hypothetical protein CI238_00635 [Colletotrichum incanum]
MSTEVGETDSIIQQRPATSDSSWTVLGWLFDDEVQQKRRYPFALYHTSGLQARILLVGWRGPLLSETEA